MTGLLDRTLLPVVSRLPGWITPNAISVFRGLLIVPILALHQVHPLVAGYGFFLPAMLLDGVDGPLARHRGQTSEMGALLDATIDKLFLHGLLWLAVVPPVPVALAAALSGLDLLLTAIRAVKKRQGLTLRSNIFGKLKTVVMSFGVGFVLSQEPWMVWLGVPFLGAAAVMGGASLFGQFGDFFRKQRASP